MGRMGRIMFGNAAARAARKKRERLLEKERNRNEKMNIRDDGGEEAAKCNDKSSEENGWNLRGSELEKLVHRIIQQTNGRYTQNTYAQRLELVSDDTDHQLLNRIASSTEMDWKQRPAYYAAVCQTVAARANGLVVENGTNANEDLVEDERSIDVDDDEELFCSFCGNTRTECDLLIKGPAVHICEECVLHCYKIVIKAKRDN